MLVKLTPNLWFGRSFCPARHLDCRSSRCRCVMWRRRDGDRHRLLLHRQEGRHLGGAQPVFCSAIVLTTVVHFEILDSQMLS
jgi:hypothetical protein